MKTATLIRALPALLIVIALAACAPAATSTPVPPTKAPAATAAAPATAVPHTAAPTTAPTGEAFTFNGVKVTIPAAVASGADGKIMPAAQEQGAPELAIRPAYVEIKLAGYAAQSQQHQGMIQVFPVADYGKISQVAGERVQAMQALLTQKPAAPGEEIPMLPVYNEAQVLRPQVKYLSFGNGAGVRFVTLLSQGLMPVTNQEVFYTYQGLTTDGAYWVSAILPVSAALLPADAGAAGNPPAGGVGFPANPDGAQVKAYYQAVTDKLNATPAGQFTPSLEALDAMMQSLRIAALLTPHAGQPTMGSHDPAPARHIGAQTAPHPTSREESMATTVLQADHLAKRYGHFIAVDDLSLEVHEGEILGFLGPNGAGKTTAISMMCGLLRPDTGRVLIQGQPVQSGPAVRARVGICPQEAILWAKLTGWSNSSSSAVSMACRPASPASAAPPCLRRSACRARPIRSPASSPAV